MKTKKAIFILLTVFCLMGMFFLEANAAWLTCTVDQVGPSGTTEGVSGSYIYLTDTADPPAWGGASKKCYFGPARGKEFLAVALTALANGKKVQVGITLTPAIPPISAIYIQK